MGVKLLGKIKIHEIAKKLGLTSKEVLDVANKLNIDVKSHMSGVEEEEANKIEKALTQKQEDKKQEKNESKKDDKKEDKKQDKKEEKKEEKRVEKKDSKKEVKDKEKAPVIIRREVIISRRRTGKEKRRSQKARN